MLSPIDKEIELDLENLATKLLSTGEAPIFFGNFEPDLKVHFDRVSESLKNVDIVTKYDDLYPREIEIAIRYLSDAMTSLHLKSFVDQDFFFSKIDGLSCALKNHIIRSGDHWGLVETSKLATNFPKTWHLIDNTEIHIHQTIPGYTNSSLWLSELLSSVSQEKFFIRPDIFRLNPVGTSSMLMERAAMYGKPFQKEWLKTLKKVEIAEHAPNPSNLLEQGHRTQFIWEPLLSQKKVQFAIEELPDSDSKLISTRFIHGIYDLATEKFEHFDGAIHVYTFDEYQVRLTQHLKNHNNNYDKAKIFLVDSGITIEQGEKLISAFYRWNTMPIEYFTQAV